MFGRYDIDKWFLLIGTIMNVLLSVILSHYVGLPGIMAGTFLSHIFFWIGRTKVVFSLYKLNELKRYIVNQTIYFLSAISLSSLLLFLFGDSAVGHISFIVKWVCSLALTILFICLGLFFTKSFNYLVNIFKMIGKSYFHIDN